MEQKVETILKKYNTGMNCSQSIISTYAPLLGYKEEDIINMKNPFKDFLGQKHDICGAVEGALKIIWLKEHKDSVNPEDMNKKSFDEAKLLKVKFKEIHDSIYCKDLLGCDISSVYGQIKALESDLCETKCVQYLKDVSVILDKIISD